MARTKNGNARSHFAPAHCSEEASRAAMASIFAAAEAAPVDVRNSAVVVQCGSEDTSSSSSDSDSSAPSEPSSEPSPPKSVPKPESGAFVARGFFKSQMSPFGAARKTSPLKGRDTASGVLSQGKATVATAETNRFGFASSAVSFASMCSTDETASPNCSFGSAKTTNPDEGKLSVSQLGTSAAEANKGEAGDAVSQLPPKLVFKFKTMPDMTAAAAEETNHDACAGKSCAPARLNQSTNNFVVGERPSAHPSPVTSATAPFTFFAPSATYSQLTANASTSKTAAPPPPPASARNNTDDCATADSTDSRSRNHLQTNTSNIKSCTNAFAFRAHDTLGVPAAEEPRAATPTVSVEDDPRHISSSVFSPDELTSCHTSPFPQPSSAGTQSRRSFADMFELFGTAASASTRSASTASPLGAFPRRSAATASAVPYFSPYHNLPSVTLEISDASLIAKCKSGAIYRAASDLSKLAVKVATRPVGKKAGARFEKEVVTLRNLPEHPCLVRHHGTMVLGNSDKVGVLSDLVIGNQTMHSRLYSTICHIDDSTKCRILLQILDAIVFLHSHDVTHRDLSLKHVLYSYGMSSETIKLVGYGLPTLHSGGESRNPGFSTNEWIGASPAYTSPEVLRGELSFHDTEGWKRSDIFSFAILMTELLMEELPWDGEAPVYIASAVKRGKRPFDLDGTQLFGKKSSELEAIIQSAWHQDPLSRPTAKELYDKLSSLFPSSDASSNLKMPVTARPTGTSTSDDRVGEVEGNAPDGSALRSAGFRFASQPCSPSQFSFSTPLPSTAKHGSAPSEFSLFGTTTSAQWTFRQPTAPATSSFSSSAGVSSERLLSSFGFFLTISDKTLIAKGNRGSIYRGTRNGGDVAVKIMDKPKTRSASSRVEKEIIALKNLPDHPNLVRHYGSRRIGEGNQCGIVADLVFGGESIETRLHRMSYRIEEVDKHRVLLQLVDAIAYLHAHDITHRDLSWRHVLRTYDSAMAIKLVDFGLPTLRGASTATSGSLSFAMMGCTVEYASPEVLRGELSNREDNDWESSSGGWAASSTGLRTGKCGWKASDVYSFAILMAELLLEQKPWDNELPVYVVNAVTKQGKRPFQVEDVRVFGKRSPKLEALIQEAWQDDPSKRPTALNVKIRLESILKAK